MTAGREDDARELTARLFITSSWHQLRATAFKRSWPGPASPRIGEFTISASRRLPWRARNVDSPGHGEGVEDRPHDVWAWLSACSVELRDSNPDRFHAIDSRPVWWTASEARGWSPASSVDRDCASRLVSSLVISVVVKLTFSLIRNW